MPLAKKNLTPSDEPFQGSNEPVSAEPRPRAVPPTTSLWRNPLAGGTSPEPPARAPAQERSSTPRSPVRVRRVKSSDALAAVRELRYDVLVLEQGWTYPADRIVGKQLHHPADTHGWVFYATLSSQDSRGGSSQSSGGGR